MHHHSLVLPLLSVSAANPVAGVLALAGSALFSAASRRRGAAAAGLDGTEADEADAVEGGRVDDSLFSGEGDCEGEPRVMATVLAALALPLDESAFSPLDDTTRRISEDEPVSARPPPLPPMPSARARRPLPLSAGAAATYLLACEPAPSIGKVELIAAETPLGLPSPLTYASAAALPRGCGRDDPGRIAS